MLAEKYCHPYMIMLHRFVCMNLEAACNSYEVLLCKSRKVSRGKLVNN